MISYVTTCIVLPRFVTITPLLNIKAFLLHLATVFCIIDAYFKTRANSIL